MIQHCRKTSHSRTRENRLVIQIYKALWRKLERMACHYLFTMLATDHSSPLILVSFQQIRLLDLAIFLKGVLFFPLVSLACPCQKLKITRNSLS